MEGSKILSRLDAERRTLARDGEVLDVLPDVTRLRATDGSHHTVIFSSLTDENADVVIGREVEHYRGLDVGFEWKVYAHDAPGDMLQRLARHGFDIGPCEAVLAYDLSAPPPWIDEPAADGGPRVERVDRLEQIGDYRAVAVTVFGKDYDFTVGRLADAIRAGSTQHRGYVAYLGGTPASIGRLYTHPASAFAGLYGGATLPIHRGRGLYRATVAARARDAMDLGAKYLVVDALPTSRPILERLGFQWLTDTWPCEWITS